jgi:putative hydrolase of the HAD superfamily
LDVPKRKMEKNIKAVLFDVDDTLFDRNLAQRKVLDLIVSQLPDVFNGLEKKRILEAFLESDRISTEEFNAGAPWEGGRDGRNRIFLRLLGLPENYASTITELYVRKSSIVKAPVPGAVSTVKNLSKRFKVGVISNGAPDVQYRKLETIGLRDLFSCIVLSEEIGSIRKPDPRIFQLALSSLHLLSSECLYVGDSYMNDVVGAKGVGMQVCWLNRKTLKPADEKIKADFVISKLEELTEILGKYK